MSVQMVQVMGMQVVMRLVGLMMMTISPKVNLDWPGMEYVVTSDYESSGD